MIHDDLILSLYPAGRTVFLRRSLATNQAQMPRGVKKNSVKMTEEERQAAQTERSARPPDPVSSLLFSSLLFSSRLVSSLLVSSRLVSSRLFSSRLFSSLARSRAMDPGHATVAS